MIIIIPLVGRYLMLHRHGGLYLDLDFVVLHPLVSLGSLGSLGAAAVVFEPPEFVTNALMAFPPRHGLLQLILNYLGAHTQSCDPAPDMIILCIRILLQQGCVLLHRPLPRHQCHQTVHKGVNSTR